MADDAGHQEEQLRARRPGRMIATTALAVLLLLGGSAAVAIGLFDQDANPPAPRLLESSVSSPQTVTASALPAPAPSAPSHGQTATPSQAPAPLPVSVSIPAIDVQSELITVGLNSDGSLEVPPPGPDYDKAAWFKGSPRPGDVGPATIEGHVDSARNGPSVFYKLGNLVAGDLVDVTRKGGSVTTFVVYEMHAFPKDGFPTLKVYGNTAGPELRLITCGGPFDTTTGRYVNNTVVFARQE